MAPAPTGEAASFQDFWGYTRQHELSAIQYPGPFIPEGRGAKFSSQSQSVAAHSGRAGCL